MSKFVRDAVTYPNPADLMPSLRIEYFIYIIIIFLVLVTILLAYKLADGKNVYKKRQSTLGIDIFSRINLTLLSF